MAMLLVATAVKKLCCETTQFELVLCFCCYKSSHKILRVIRKEIAVSVF